LEPQITRIARIEGRLVLNGHDLKVSEICVICGFARLPAEALAWEEQAKAGSAFREGSFREMLPFPNRLEWSERID
jgi:hypothetical protein